MSKTEYKEIYKKRYREKMKEYFPIDEENIYKINWWMWVNYCSECWTSISPFKYMCDECHGEKWWWVENFVA